MCIRDRCAPTTNTVMSSATATKIGIKPILATAAENGVCTKDGYGDVDGDTNTSYSDEQIRGNR